MENLTFHDFCKEKLSPLIPTNFSDFTEFLQAHDLSENQENSPLVPGLYDKSTIETKEEDLYDPANETHDTQESVYYDINPRTSVGKSYLSELPVLKMKSGQKEKKVHVLENFNKEFWEIKGERSARKMRRNVRCNCKKSQCLKNYCDCLAEGRFCGENCCCKGCKNVPGMKKESAKKRKKVIWQEEENEEEEVRREFKGCNCKRSRCEKKYCDCFSLGMKCGEDCCCVNCKNKPVKLQGGGSRKLLKLMSADEKRSGMVERKERGFSSVRKIVDWNQSTLSIFDGDDVNFGLKLFTDHIDGDVEGDANDELL